MPRLLLLLTGSVLYAQSFPISPDLTVSYLNDRQQPRLGSYHGDVAFYPASLCKLFYLNAAQAWMQSGKLKETPELGRAGARETQRRQPLLRRTSPLGQHHLYAPNHPSPLPKVMLLTTHKQPTHNNINHI
jgi:hypothetical protein